MTGPLTRRLRPIPALDGVRGVAVAAVVLFHFPTTTVVPGGMFGVDVFFVLSGFLVTAGLLDSADAGRLSVGAFLGRRAWRLLPALAALLAVVTVMAALFRHDPWFTADPLIGPGRPISMAKELAGVGFALAYIFNFSVIFSWRNAMPFAHLWTLAIEGQFYVGWALLTRRIIHRRRSLLMPVSVGIIVASAVSPFLMWSIKGGTSFVQGVIYFGTVPRLQQLVAGALLAQLWRTGRLDWIPRRVFGAAAVLCGAGVLVMFFEVGNVTFKYLGAETVVAALALVVVAYLLDAPAGDVGPRLVSNPVLRWLGTRSYAIYLWHWPFAVWTDGFDHAWGTPLGIAGSLVASEVSWRLVERPAQRYAAAHRRRRSAQPARPPAPPAALPTGQPTPERAAISRRATG